MEFENISLKEGIKLSRDKKHYILMDVREEERYKRRAFRKCDQLSLWNLKKSVMNRWMGKKIIVYCDFGGQSMMAQTLEERWI